MPSRKIVLRITAHLSTYLLHDNRSLRILIISDKNKCFTFLWGTFRHITTFLWGTFCHITTFLWGTFRIWVRWKLQTQKAVARARRLMQPLLIFRFITIVWASSLLFCEVDLVVYIYSLCNGCTTNCEDKSENHHNLNPFFFNCYPYLCFSVFPICLLLSATVLSALVTSWGWSCCLPLQPLQELHNKSQK